MNTSKIDYFAKVSGETLENVMFYNLRLLDNKDYVKFDVCVSMGWCQAFAPVEISVDRIIGLGEGIVKMMSGASNEYDFINEDGNFSMLLSSKDGDRVDIDGVCMRDINDISVLKFYFQTRVSEMLTLYKDMYRNVTREE